MRTQEEDQRRWIAYEKVKAERDRLAAELKAIYPSFEAQLWAASDIGRDLWHKMIDELMHLCRWRVVPNKTEDTAVLVNEDAAASRRDHGAD